MNVRRPVLSIVLALGCALILAERGDAQGAPMRCTVTTSTSVSFGGYDVFDTAPLDGTGFVTLECTRVGAADQVMIEIGHGGERSFTSRSMKNGRNKLAYNLYLDAARTMIWGDGTGGSSAFRARPPEGRALSVPIFGRIPPGQNATPGAYSDRLIVTVQY